MPAPLPMPDYSRKSRITLSCGRSGSGKTTFCFLYLANALTPQPANDEPATCVFIFDWKNEAEERFGIPAVTTLHGLESSLADRLVIFNPHSMFPGDQRVKTPEDDWALNDEKMAFRFFCRWVFEVCQRGPGRKIIYLDELKQFATRQYLPPELNRIFRMGRTEGLELLTSTQFPNDYHLDLRGSVTEWVCFSVMDPTQLEAVRPYMPNADRISALPDGSFIARNVNSGGEICGKVF